jgi:4-hydroxybenzoate polyprenyltransferase
MIAERFTCENRKSLSVYVQDCAALPASIFFAVDRTPPLWVLATGALLGVAFHFANVLKDLSADRQSSIGGLPQRTNKRLSIAIIVILIAIVAVIVANSPISETFRNF